VASCLSVYVVVLGSRMIGEEEKGIKSRHPYVSKFRHGGKEGGGNRAFNMLI